ncbi:hypothetical protein ACFWN2_04500 [Lentzea sp. NPDC058436]|uniref:hypothetical protein n=1 Tax=Lentzea sp. NPDC058436 TaxID=3346499 RepID=UPI00364AE561
MHHRFWIATVFLRPRAEGEAPPLRIFEYSAADDEKAVLDDFDRLLARKGGRGDFGYVLRDVPEPKEPLSFARHDPRLKARRESLTAFGGAATIDGVFEILPPGLHSVADRALKCDVDAPGAVRVLSGREITRDGTIVLSDEQAEWATVSADRQLCVGDVVTRAMRLPGQNLVVAEVSEEDLPAAANQSVAVLRPKPQLDGSQRTVVLQYLRSALARELLDASRGGAAHLNRQTLRELPLPRLDEALTAALSDLAEAARSFETWRIEAETVLQSAFPDDEDFEMAKSRLVEHGRTSRLRLEAASNLADQDYIVRTRFPYPIAYRWRTVEAELSAGPTRDAYNAVLQAAEVLLCYIAHLALVLARDANIEIGYSGTVRATLAKGRGLGFGD